MKTWIKYFVAMFVGGMAFQFGKSAAKEIKWRAANAIDDIFNSEEECTDNNEECHPHHPDLSNVKTLDELFRNMGIEEEDDVDEEDDSSDHAEDE